MGKSLAVAYVKLRQNTPTTCSLFCLDNAHPLIHCCPADWLYSIYTNRVSRIFRKTVEDLVSFNLASFNCIFLFRYFYLNLCELCLLEPSFCSGPAHLSHLLCWNGLWILLEIWQVQSGLWIIRLKQRSASFRQMARKASLLSNYSLVTWECFRSSADFLKVLKCKKPDVTQEEKKVPSFLAVFPCTTHSLLLIGISVSNCMLRCEVQ